MSAAPSSRVFPKRAATAVGASSHQHPPSSGARLARQAPRGAAGLSSGPGARRLETSGGKRFKWRVGAEALCGDGEECLTEQEGSVFVRDDLDTILQVLPSDLREPLARHPERANLLEIVMDLGRRPSARFLGVR